MGSGLLEFGVKIRKGGVFTIRWCLRSVCNHPFLLGVLCFFLFLYRSSPFIFSLLVSASPVLICTAVLLGTILSFGQPYIPEIEVEDETLHESVALKTGVSEDATVVEKNDSYYVARYSEKREEAEQLIEKLRLSAGEVSGVHISDDTAPLIEERSREIELENGEIYEANRELADVRYKQKVEWKEEELSDGEVLENHYASIPKHSESDDERSDADSFGSEKVNVDSLDSPPRSPWTQVMEREEEEKDKYREEEEEREDGASDSESGRAESSSPDASMADIMPMLDELHPLLDEEAPEREPMSDDESDTESEHSSSSSTSSHKSSDDDSENLEDVEDADDDNENGEEDEEEDEEEEEEEKEEAVAQEDKGKQIKSAISWTDEDQKNLMDLGSSELERNQRLENLILRRRARHNMTILQERNLIDLENFTLPFSVAPISTARQNPFDLPNDANDDSGLPPIPGSAPSVLLHRRNPFDIPYDSSEEKPDLVGDGFQEDIAASHQREMFFRRHESFNMRPSIFAPSRQQRQLRPYFVPEQMISEGSSYSSFSRQLSELSDSKVSSIPDTESVVSAEDAEDRKLIDEDNLQELEATDSAREATEEGAQVNHELISVTEAVIEERKLIGQDNPQELEAIPSIEESTEDATQVDDELISMRVEVSEEDVPSEPELSSKIEHVSDVGHGSQSSSSSDEEDEDSLDGRSDNRDVEDDELEVPLGDIESQYEKGSAERPVVRSYSSESSSSSLSVSERVFSVKEIDELSILEGIRDEYEPEPVVSSQTSLESAGTSVTSAVVDDVPQREPVYDLSPTANRRSSSSYSISSDVPGESDQGGLPPVLIKRTVSFIERESEGSSQVMDRGISETEMLGESLTLHPVDEHESETSDVVNTREEDAIYSDFTGVDSRAESIDDSAAVVTLHASVHSESTVEASVVESLMDQLTPGQAPISSSDGNIHAFVEHSENTSLDQLRKIEHSLIAGTDGRVQISEQPFEEQSVQNHSSEKEETIGNAERDAHLSFSDSDVSLEESDNQISTPATEGNESLSYDKPMDGPMFEHLSDIQAHNSPVESSDERRSLNDTNMPEIEEVNHDISSQVNSPLTPDFISIPSTPSETPTSQVELWTTVEEVDEIEEIDDLLLELDSVGDFSTKQQESVSSELEKHVDSVGESSLSAHADINTTGTFHDVEMNTVENASNSVNTVEDIDIVEEDKEHVSEIESFVIHRDGHIDISDTESVVSDVLDPPDQGTSDEMTTSKINEATHSSPFVTQSDGYMEYEIPEAEGQTSVAVDSVVDKIELTDVVAQGAEVSRNVQVEIDNPSGMPELEARAPEDIALAFKQISDKEIETPVVLEAPKDGLVDGLVGKHSDDGTSRTSDARISSDDTPIHVVESVELPGFDYEPVNDGNLHVVESREFHVAEPIPSEVTNLPTTQASDGNTEKQVEPNSSDRLVQVEADKGESSVAKSSHVQEISATAASKPKHEAKETEDLHSVKSAKGKNKVSKSSSSSSSSSSSDSDRD